MKSLTTTRFGRLFLIVMFVFVLLPTGSAWAQDLISVTYFYYGEQLTDEEMREIAADRFYTTGEYTTCAYVPSDDYSPTSVEANVTFHCFNTSDEARTFKLTIREKYQHLDQPNVAVQPDPNVPSEEIKTASSSSVHWSIFAHSFHTGWLGDITVGQTFWTSTGIWSLNDFANNEVRLFDNPGYPGQQWDFGWTQLALPAGPGGARHALHCTNPTC